MYSEVKAAKCLARSEMFSYTLILMERRISYLSFSMIENIKYTDIFLMSLQYSSKENGGTLEHSTSTSASPWQY